MKRFRPGKLFVGAAAAGAVLVLTVPGLDRTVFSIELQGGYHETLSLGSILLAVELVLFAWVLAGRKNLSGREKGGELPAKGLLQSAALAFILVTPIIFILYRSSLRDYFYWDDWRYLRYGYEIISVPTFNTIKEFFLRYSTGFLRPVGWVLIGLDFAAGGFDPRIYHVVSLLAHISVATVLAVLVLALSENRAGAIAAALLFALHPINVGQVVHIANRPYIICSFLYISSVLMHRLSINPPVRELRHIFGSPIFCRICAIFFFAAAMLTLETAVSLPLVVLLTDYLMGDRSERVSAKILRSIPYFVLLALYLSWRYLKFGPALGGYGIHTDFSAFEVLFRFLFVLPRALVLPLNELWIPSFEIVMGWIKPLSAVLIFLLLTRTFLRRNLLLYSVLFTVASALPVYNILGGNIEFLERSRDFYLPSAGFTIFLTALFFGKRERKPPWNIMQIVVPLSVAVFFWLGTKAGSREWGTYGMQSGEIVAGVDPGGYISGSFGADAKEFSSACKGREYGAPDFIPPFSHLYFIEFSPMASGFVDAYFRDWVHSQRMLKFYHFRNNLSWIDRDGQEQEFSLVDAALDTDSYFIGRSTERGGWEIINFYLAERLFFRSLVNEALKGGTTKQNRETRDTDSAVYLLECEDDPGQWLDNDRIEYTGEVFLNHEGEPGLRFGGHDNRFEFKVPAFSPLRFEHLSVEMAITADLGQALIDSADSQAPRNAFAELRWRDPRIPDYHVENRITFPIRVDGNFHEYTIPIAESPAWLLAPSVSEFTFYPYQEPSEIFIKDIHFIPYASGEQFDEAVMLSGFFDDIENLEILEEVIDSDWLYLAVPEKDGMKIRAFSRAIAGALQAIHTGEYAGADACIDEAAGIAGASTLPAKLALLAGISEAENMGDREKTISQARRALARFPEFFPFRLQLARFLVDAESLGRENPPQSSPREIAEGIEVLENIAKDRPAFYETHLILARLFNHLEEPDKAVREWRKVLELRPYGSLAEEAMDSIPAIEDPDARFTRHNGFAYIFKLPAEFSEFDDSNTERALDAVLFEDGTPLPYPHVLHHPSIQKTGYGRYGHSKERIIFSTTDNSDPNENGRKYYVKALPSS